MAVREDMVDRRVSLLSAAAYLGVTPSALRHQLRQRGWLEVEEGRAYLTVPIEEVGEVMARARQQMAALPGWSAAEVARRLGIRQDTVYRLHQLGKLEAVEVEAPGRRRWRFDPEAVRAYAARVGRTLAEDMPAR